MRPSRVLEPPTDGRRARGVASRTAILDEAVQLASTDGLEGLSIGVLAERVGVPKSSVHASFGSKEELQLAVLRKTREIMVAVVVTPTLVHAEGLDRLIAVGETWIGYLQDELFVGGCVLSSASSEFDGRPGPVRDLVVRIMREWMRFLADNVRAAVADGSLSAATDPEQLAFELHSIGLTVNWHRQLLGGAKAFRYGRTAWQSALDRSR
jgi:AcrR family transcriptional regulator